MPLASAALRRIFSKTRIDHKIVTRNCRSCSIGPKSCAMARQPISSLQSPIKTAINREPLLRDSKCNKMIAYVAKRDESNVHKFAPLQRTSSLFGETSTTSTSTRSSEPEDLSAQRIRANYFYRLGIGKPQVASPTYRNGCIQAHLRRQSDSVFESSHTEVLKDDLGQADPSLTKNSSPQYSKFNKDSKVSFSAEVSIHLIPHRNHYSSQDKERLWMLPHELEEMAYRNCVEFTLEHWDWKQAIEESDFVLLQGILTHPAHAMMIQQQQQQRCTPSRQFCMIFSAQQQHSRRHHKPEHQGYTSHLNTRYRWADPIFIQP